MIELKKLWWIKGTFSVLILLIPASLGWGKGHYATCKIAQGHWERHRMSSWQILLCHYPKPETEFTIYNYTEQLVMGYNASNSVTQYNLTEALMFLSHYIGDVHQGMITII
nr:endonuclease 4-like [Tanacetum cinerariifolium]